MAKEPPIIATLLIGSIWERYLSKLSASIESGAKTGRARYAKITFAKTKSAVKPPVIANSAARVKRVVCHTSRKSTERNHRKSA